jgi:ribonuclease P protein component
MPNTFSKEERLYKKKEIEQVFDQSKSFLSYPLRFSYRLIEPDINTPFSFKVLVMASKKRYKTAVERNRIKRLCREAFRLNKYVFDDVKDIHATLLIAVTCVSTELPAYKQVLEQMAKGLEKIKRDIK